MPIRIHLLLIVGCLLWAGCVHRIEVNPLPVDLSTTTIPRTVQLIIRPITLVGADHRQGITLLEWPHSDVSQAVFGYVQERGTFLSVSMDQADLALHLATKLLMTTRQGRYHYRIMVQAEMNEAALVKKSYLVEQTAVGSSVRWITASDRDPIKTALRLALEGLMSQIEADRPFYLATGQSSQRSRYQALTPPGSDHP
jgi:hypothetical protein